MSYDSLLLVVLQTTYTTVAIMREITWQQVRWQDRKRCGRQKLMKLDALDQLFETHQRRRCPSRLGSVMRFFLPVMHLLTQISMCDNERFVKRNYRLGIKDQDIYLERVYFANGRAVFLFRCHFSSSYDAFPRCSSNERSHSNGTIEEQSQFSIRDRLKMNLAHEK